MLKRDVFCKWHASILWTRDGLFLTVPDSKVLLVVRYLKSANGFQFCWTFLGFNLA